MADNQPAYSESQYAELKKYIGQSLNSAAEQHNKAILALSGGAIGLSIAFLKDIAPKLQEGTACWLFAAWTTFTLAICLSLLSFQAAMCALRSLERSIDAVQASPGSSQTASSPWWNRGTMGLNLLSLVCFVVGASSLFVFSFQNLLNKENRMPNENRTPPAAQVRGWNTVS